MSRTPSERTCTCGCAVRDNAVLPATALRPALRPDPSPGAVAARRRPVARGCTCRLCRPGRDSSAPDDTGGPVLRNVRAAGWHLTGVGASGDDPAFVYTVGLGHRAGHPELLMSGQPLALMAQVLNDVAERVVVGGHRLAVGTVVEGALAWHPLVVDELTPAAADETVRLSSWLHRRPPRALQLVWPDAQGVFGWQPGGRDTSAEQPPGWRAPAVPTDGVAADPGWQLGTPAEHLAAACRHVVLDGESPMTVIHARTRGRTQWVLVCGRDDREHDHDEDWAHQHLAHAVRGTPSLRGLDLAEGEAATRRGPSAPWRRFWLS